MGAPLVNDVLLSVVASCVFMVDSRVIQTTSTTTTTTTPTTTSLPPCAETTYYESCPRDTLPSKSLFDPSVGTIQLSCGTSAETEGKCVTLGDDNITETFMCPVDHVLVGSDNDRPICCQLKGFCPTDCFKPNILYSFKLGFEFEIKEGYALSGMFNYGSCSEDPTVFQIEVCKLTTCQRP